MLFCVFVEVLGSICIAFQIKTSYTTNTQLFFSVFICNGIRIMAHTFSAMNVSNVSMLGEDDNKYIINSIMICQFVFSFKKILRKKDAKMKEGKRGREQEQACERYENLKRNRFEMFKSCLKSQNVRWNSKHIY